MEDFEYSVEICDRDWDCFFKECDECDLLPPSIAGVDDSGMSDIDDTRSIFARSQKVGVKESFSEADCSIEGPPNCEGSPVENYLSRRAVSGMESILSGSEEDIHLQSVNMFFERLKIDTEAESLIEPGQVGDDKKVEEEKFSDSKKGSSSMLPKTCLKLNSPTARDETAVSKDSTEPVNTVSSRMKTMKKDYSSYCMPAETATSTSAHKTSNPSQPETNKLIIGEAGTTTRINEATPSINIENKVGKCTTQDEAKDDRMLTGRSKCSTDLWSNLEMLTNVKWKKDQNSTALQSDATSSNKTAGQESSPSASLKRKRRKKRRLSIEPAESLQGCERQVAVKQSDSEEEQCLRRVQPVFCVSEDIHLPYFNQPPKSMMMSLSPYSPTSNVPVRKSKVQKPHYNHPCQSQYQYFPESLVGHINYFETNATDNRSVNEVSKKNNIIMLEQISDNVATILQPCSQLQVYDSGGLNQCSGLPVSISDSLSGKSANSESLYQSDDIDKCINYCNNKEHNPLSSIAEVNPITQNNSPSTESSDPTVDVSQNDRVSAAKSILAIDVGISGRTLHELCEREAEPHQQLETDCHYTDQYSSTLGKTQFPVTAISTSSSDICHTNPKPINNRAFLKVEELSTEVDCFRLPPNASKSLPDECSQSQRSPTLDIIMNDKQTNNMLLQAKPKVIFSPVTDKAEENSELDKVQVVPFLSENLSVKMNRAGALDTESAKSLSNEGITDLTESSCSSLCQNGSGQGDKTSLLLAKHKEYSLAKSEPVLDNPSDFKFDVVVDDEDSLTSKEACETEKALESKPSVFAMSSFWSEMEKLTINDILGLRMTNKTAPSSFLPPLQESEETDTVSLNDSGFFTQSDDSKHERTNENTFNDINSAVSDSAVPKAVNASSSKSVTWDSEPVASSPGAAMYTKNLMLTSESDIFHPVLPGSAQACPRKISKNISVHNLPALESESYNYSIGGQSLRILDEGHPEKVEYSTDGHVSNQDKDYFASSSTDSYRLSLTDIFQYLFGGKQPSPSHSTTDIKTSGYTDGNSVPETYDHFFSDFDTESFFSPLIAIEDQDNDRLVPIFSCSRSSYKNLQFPEAYEHFFASSSSDESSDDEDSSGPVRVVTRFSRTSSTSKICTDIYDNFFTDSDLRQDFFWKNTFSFRNMFLAGSTVQTQTLSNPVSPPSLKPSIRSFRRTDQHINVLGNQDIMFADPLLYNLEDRISKQLAQRTLGYEDLQTAVSNPRLDVSLLPLKHSDMCLLCIAFASWVLKTTNPQVGDAWKAVLLANVSALSAIRYLRKYVRMEAAAGDKKLQDISPAEP